MRLGRRPRHEQAVARGDDPRGDGGNLGGTLALAEDDFGKTLPDVAVVVDAREVEILVRLLAQKLKESLVCRLRRDRTGTDIVEQGAKLLTVHRGK
jgi:hypothetical protein